MYREGKIWKVYLTFDELSTLDGKCNERLQKEIDVAKAERKAKIESGLDDVSIYFIGNAVRNGELHWQYINIQQCNLCGKRPRYVEYARTSRYHKKGEPNLNKPIPYDGVEIVKGRGTCMRSSGIAFDGICAECWDDVYLTQIAKYILDNDLPVEIGENKVGETRYLKDEECICEQCDGLSYESELGERRTLMGNGSWEEHYKCLCPHCGNDTNVWTGKWRMIRN